MRRLIVINGPECCHRFREEDDSRSFCSGLSLGAASAEFGGFSFRRSESSGKTFPPVWCACDDVMMLVPQWASAVLSKVVKIWMTDVGGIDFWK